MTRSLLSLALLLLLFAAACTDRDAPPPVPVPAQDPAAATTRPLSSHEAAVDPDDPAEPGIPDLARLARYVFKAMQRHDTICAFDNPFRDRLHFALEVEVKAGRMAGVALGQVGLEPAAGGDARTLAKAQWPLELTAYVTCLAPHLQAVTMVPSPPDGVYEPAYSYGGNAAGRTAP